MEQIHFCLVMTTLIQKIINNEIKECILNLNFFFLIFCNKEEKKSQHNILASVAFGTKQLQNWLLF